jgi:hypothetical protein
MMRTYKYSNPDPHSISACVWEQFEDLIYFLHWQRHFETDYALTCCWTPTLKSENFLSWWNAFRILKYRPTRLSNLDPPIAYTGSAIWRMWDAICWCQFPITRHFGFNFDCKYMYCQKQLKQTLYNDTTRPVYKTTVRDIQQKLYSVTCRPCKEMNCKVFLSWKSPQLNTQYV